MFPELFKARVRSQQYIDAESLLSALQEPAPVSIRTNPYKWKFVPADSEPVIWCSNGFYLEKRPSFTTDPLFNSGCYYPQEASGMFLEQVFLQIAGNPEYIKVLDLCGAPGGKSTHISSLIGERGLLVSNEVIRSRASVLAENLTKWGLSNAMVTRSDPSEFAALTGFFDVILVDAPCSGEGMFRDKTAISEWSPENASHCAERQKRILMDIWPALKENGMLIYSTCTFNPGENEENIKWLTQQHEAETFVIDISDFEGITEIDFEGIRGYGFYPGKIRGEGLFMSVLRKTSKQASMRSGNKEYSEHKLSKEDRTAANKWTGFPDENLIKSGNEIISVAGSYNDYLLIEKHLKIIKPGTRILTIKSGDLLPSHELAMSVIFRPESFPSVIVTPEIALNYLHRDSILLKEAPKGWNILTYFDVPLGFINNIGTRVNNYYPVEWRIRMNISDAATGSIIKWQNE